MKPFLTYRCGGSPLHRLHPLLKLLWLIWITAAVFMVPDAVFSLGLVAVLALAFPLIGIRLRELGGLKLLLGAALLIFILQAVFWKEGELALVIGAVKVTDQGLVRGIYLGARFLAVVLVSYLFVMTTSPNQLAYSLMRAGMPYRYGFTFVTALRMIPIFEEEIRTVFRAQQVRGMSYRPGSWREIWKNLNRFTLPMLVSALGKVDALSISMEGRCFGMHRTRTYYQTREKYPGDLWAGLALALSIILVVWLNFWEG